jgi:xanthine dehydrogenase/oxidase
MAPIAVSPDRAPAFFGQDLTTAYHDTLRFYLNGTRVVLDEIDPEVTLLEYLRGIGLTGTKLWVPKMRLFPHTRTSLTLLSQWMC